MRRKVRTIKLCVNCRHLKVIGEGQEIEGLEETRYLETRCDVFDHTTRELYQFPVEQGALVLHGVGSTDCPFWEPWDLSQKELLEDETVEDAEVDRPT